MAAKIETDRPLIIRLPDGPEYGVQDKAAADKATAKDGTLAGGKIVGYQDTGYFPHTAPELPEPPVVGPPVDEQPPVVQA